MNKILKAKVSEIEKEFTNLKGEISHIETKIEYQSKIISKISEENNKNTSGLKEKLRNYLEECKQLSSTVIDNKNIISNLEDKIVLIKRMEDKSFTLNVEYSMCENQLKKVFSVKDKCSLCGTKLINDDSILSQKMHFDEERKIIEDKREELKVKISDINEILSKIKKYKTEYENASITKNKSEILLVVIKKQMNSLVTEIDSVTTKNIDPEIKILESFQDDLKNSKLKYVEIFKQRNINTISLNLLKDNGIKAKIIQIYIPMFVTLVNKYIEEMGYDCQFSIDENFVDSIKYNGNTYDYKSFSGGQRMRIDLAVLFAWRELCTIKNSADCNLLALDEFFDSALDSNGADDLMSILSTQKKTTNVFVISHRGDNFLEKLDNHIELELKNGFTQLA